MEKSWSKRNRLVEGSKELDGKIGGERDTVGWVLYILEKKNFKSRTSFWRDDLETQMPSGRGSTSTALGLRHDDHFQFKSKHTHKIHL